MDNVVKEILSPNGLYKAQIIKRSEDGFFTSQIFKWIEHDDDVCKIMGEKGCWGKIFSTTLLTDTLESCVNVTMKNLTNDSGEKISYLY